MRRLLLFIITLSFSLSIYSRAQDDIYSQSIAVEYASPEDANAATAKILSLPDNKKIAFSTRWDDSEVRHRLTAEMLAERDMFATCYLVAGFNAPKKEAFNKVLELGGALGAHCLSHPHLETMIPNEIFREVALERAIVESSFDTNVVGFVLPYMTYQTPLDKNVRDYVGRSIINAGYRFSPEITMDFATRYGIKKSGVFSSHTFGVGDRDPQRDRMLSGVESGRKKIAKGAEPHITLGIHSWQDDEARARLGKYIDEVKSDDFWYCNANDYVAYRAHVLKSKIVKFAVKGNVAIFELRRISAVNIGSDIPLSVEFSNSPKSVLIGGKKIESKNGIYNIEHYDVRKCPKKIDMIKFANSGDTLESKKFKGLNFSFSFDRDTGKISVKLGGKTRERVTNFRVRWVIPPCYKTPIDSLLYGANGDTVSTKLKPLSAAHAEEYTKAFSEGNMLVMAQCDFLLDDVPSRVWLVREDARDVKNSDCPRDNALCLGDFDASLNDADAFAKMSSPDAILESFAGLNWSPKSDKNKREFVVNFNGFLIIKKYANAEMSLLICGDFNAPRSGKCDLYTSSHFVKEAYLNGVKIDKLKPATSVEMKKGKNRILLVLNKAAVRANGITFAVKDGDKFLKCLTPETK